MPSAPHDGEGRIAGGRDLTSVVRIALRPIGSPLPLGILALVPASVTLAILQLGGISVRQSATVGLLLLAFVFPLQLVTSILAFLGRDSVVGTGLGLFAGTWLITGLQLIVSAPGSRSPALGVFLLSVAACFAVVVAGAAMGKAGTAAVLTVGAARFVLTGLYEMVGGSGLEHAVAICGLGLAVAALYVALATLLEDARGETKLPLARRDMARQALDAGFEEQLERLEHEAGVRQQL